MSRTKNYLTRFNEVLPIASLTGSSPPSIFTWRIDRFHDAPPRLPSSLVRMDLYDPNGGPERGVPNAL